MLRLVLGALAGISIGWFLRPEVTGSDALSSISPLALAFAAGYSVELVFTAMDKILGAFAPPETVQQEHRDRVPRNDEPGDSQRSY